MTEQVVDMTKLTDASKADIQTVYHELFCMATTITKEGIAVAQHLHDYLSEE